MPKAIAKAVAAVKASVAAEAEAKPKVSAAVVVAVSAVINAVAAADSAIRASEQSWVKLAGVIRKETTDEEIGAAILKEAFSFHIDKILKEATEEEDLTEEEQKAFKTRLDLKYGSYRSKIKTLAFPTDAKLLERAIEENMGVNELLPVARGKLRPNKKGEWITVEDTGAGNKGSGGHNKIKPLDSLKKSLALAFTAAHTAKIDEEQLAVVIGENCKDAFDLETLIEALQKQLD